MFRHSERRPSGIVIVTDASGTVEHDTKQCCHCGQHWIVKPGSGTLRGFCQLCNASTCGHPGCMSHMAFEKKLELYEKGILSSLGE